MEEQTKSVSTVPELPKQPLPLEVDNLSTMATDERFISEYTSWLSFQPVWGQLQQETLQAIAKSLHCFTVKLGTLIYQEKQTSIVLYLLKSGTVEIYRQSPIGKSLIHYRNAGQLFGYLPLLANSDDATYQSNAIAITNSEILFLPLTKFRRLIAEYTEIQQVINSQLAQDLDDFTMRIAWEEERNLRLPPLHTSC